MKKFFLLFLGIPVLGICQEKSTTAFDKANVITIKNGMSAQDNFALLQTTLLSKGYIIISNRKDRSVQTRDSVLKADAVSYSFNAVAKGDSVILTGKFSTSVQTTPLGGSPSVFTYDISNTGSKSSAGRKLFFAMQDLGKELHGNLYYTRIKRKRAAVF